MANRALQTASRSLSLATFTVAGLGLWLLANSSSTPNEAEPATASPPVTQAAGESTTTPVPRATTSIATVARDSTRTPKTARSEGAAQKPSRSSNASIPNIPPELGRLSRQPSDAPATEPAPPAEAASVTEAASESDEPATKSPSRPPRAPRNKPTSGAIFRVPEAMLDPGLIRVESQLSAMQRKIEQLAQLQVDQKNSDTQRASELLQQLQQQKQIEQFEKLLKELEESKKAAANVGQDAKTPATNGGDAATAEPKTPPDPAKEPPPVGGETQGTKGTGFVKLDPTAGHTDRFDNIEFRETDISHALAMLGQLSGMNILIGRGVSGQVPAANLQNVTAEEALDALTRSLGFVYEREGNFVFVWTQTDAQARKQAARKTTTKIYRPRYISVAELQSLVTPLLTKVTGLVAVTHAPEVGLEISRTKAGGDSLSQNDALLVVDFPEVIAQIDQIMTEIDVPPSQVVIEAMILSVKLTDTMKMGVNFALLNGSNKQLVTTGNGAQLNNSTGFPNKDTLLPIGGDFVAATTGLKYGFLAGDLSGFVEALETLAETSIVASPSVRVLNKQKAELIIGERLGYKTSTFNGTQTIENINFLEVGTKLVLRPFVAQDGLVRMEIHPERSDGTINEAGLPQSRTTEVTSNVMIRDGSTIVIGGLIEEQANQSQSRVPGLGALPVVGNLFKNKSNDTARTELIVLITPRIIRDFDAETEGDLTRFEHERRHQEFREKLSPINRHTLARIEYERAARYFEEGDVPRAKRHIDESLRHNRNDSASIRLRDQITAALNDKNWWKKLRRKPQEPYHRIPSNPTSSPDGEAIFEEMIPTPSNGPQFVPPVPTAPESSRSSQPTTQPATKKIASRS